MTRGDKDEGDSGTRIWRAGSDARGRSPRSESGQGRGGGAHSCGGRESSGCVHPHRHLRAQAAASLHAGVGRRRSGGERGRGRHTIARGRSRVRESIHDGYVCAEGGVSGERRASIAGESFVCAGSGVGSALRHGVSRALPAGTCAARRDGFHSRRERRCGHRGSTTGARVRDAGNRYGGQRARARTGVEGRRA